MELRVNDYVRTKDGKIINIQVLQIIKDINCDYVEINYEKILRNNIVKSSPNIIDLIEVGDYVNGDIVIKSAPKDKRKKQEIIIDSTCVEYGELPLRQEDIKSIVTREMFKSMEYKVGEQ